MLLAVAPVGDGKTWILGVLGGLVGDWEEKGFEGWWWWWLDLVGLADDGGVYGLLPPDEDVLVDGFLYWAWESLSSRAWIWLGSGAVNGSRRYFWAL